MNELGPIELRARLEDLSKQESFSAEMRGVMAAAAAAIGSVGECRKDTPFKPIYMIRDKEGLRYCCGHPDGGNHQICDSV